ncbi:hypothetical protein D7030_15110 [Flavobacteriaceae bacterium AU392]|nr:hypothetical protein D1817_03380 [Flavobacteriaceae bacterium]RKM81623.1 hypothetical protein D7030_15110 [Flavobacteriaceae bacterium AU392]
MKFLLTLLFVISTSLSFSQPSEITPSENIPSENITPLVLKRLNSTPTGKIIGSAYLNASFLPAKIKSQGDEIFLIRFNAYNGNMEVIKAEGEKPRALNPINTNYKITFVDSKKIYKAHSYTNKEGTLLKGFFVEVNSSENIALFKKERISFIPAAQEAASTYKQGQQEAKFKRVQDTYYISRNSSDLELLPKKKKKFVKLFSSKYEKDILTFIKENSIKLSKEEDIIKVINYINKNGSIQ